MRRRLAFGHLELMLCALHRACRHVAAAMGSSIDADTPVDRPVSDEEMSALLTGVERRVASPLAPAPLMSMTIEEVDRADEFRKAASDLGFALPIDVLVTELRLDPIDLCALLVFVAPELDRSYERIYAYLADEPVRRFPSVETALLLTSGLLERHEQRLALGAFGALRRWGLVLPHGTAQTDLRQELRLAPGVLEFLLGADIEVASLVNPDVRSQRSGRAVEVAPYGIADLGAALMAGLVDTIGLSGTSPELELDAALAIVGAAGRSIRCYRSGRPGVEGTVEAARRAAHDAAVAGAALVVEIESPNDDGQIVDHAPVGWLLEHTTVPIVLAGVRSWRPARHLADRTYVECSVRGPDELQRATILVSETGEPLRIDEDRLARRWKLSEAELRAAAGSARAAVALGGRDAVRWKDVDDACAAVAAVTSGSLVTAVKPRRGPESLVLPEDVHRQVVEIAQFARSLDVVHSRWGFDRIWGGGPGYKALFHGEPGTGKTLAAEVIAKILGVQLLKVDLSRVVSRWVGETAKNLSLVFREGATTNGVMFFDEADALLGKRADVRQASDRYANSEVAHLLQLIEQHDGLVLLATNLRENLDPAFTRRFHRVVHFPRPSKDDRLRLWQLAFPGAAPLDSRLDLGVLSELELTGSGIVSAARTACLQAADRESKTVCADDVVDGIERQFQTEGRLLSATERQRYRRALVAAR
jgi:hypothetical protein